MSAKSRILQQLPSVNKVLQQEDFGALLDSYSRELVVQTLQEYLDHLRQELRTGDLSEELLPKRLSALEPAVRARLEGRLTPSLRTVINATGVILHTNLGRAPLSSDALRAVHSIAASYSNLEYDISSGRRSHRDLHFERRLNRLLGCEAATVCNNNAASVLLALNTLAFGKKVLVSRGELIEIGGSFRIPAIMERSGAVMVEVGTTNKTKLSDYRQAMDDRTGLILRVHPSNYKIVGFTHRPQLSELVALSHETKVPLYEDVGSGLLFPTNHRFLNDEPSVLSELEEEVDLVSFSGDKLLGGPQAGLIVGKKKLVDEIRRNPLMRACRVDKVTYALLEWTLLRYERGEHGTVPIHRMLTASAEEIQSRSERLKSLLPRSLEIEVCPDSSVIGGGSAPEEHIPTYVIAVRSKQYSANQLQDRLRNFQCPIVARIEDDRVILDMRTVFPEQEAAIISAFAEMEGS